MTNSALIAFKSGAMPDDKMRCRGFIGRERLSRLFEFDLLLVRPTPFTEEETDSLLKTPCVLAMGGRKGDVVHGLLRSIELIDAARSEAARYVATMVPSLWLMTLARTNRLYQNTTVPKMVQEILEQYGLGSGKDFVIAAWDKSPEREYVVQYEESDWDFIQRWLEHEGYFYWFEHGDGGEKLVIAHENAVCPPIVGTKLLSYRERNNLGGPATVWDWHVRTQRIPARVALFDYNYRRPNQRVVAKADVDTERGFGSVFFYGQHFKNQDQGADLAQVRADLINTGRVTILGRTDCASFRVGHVFELENHHIADQDGEYLVTAIEHRSGFPPDRDGAKDLEPYTARFEAIPADVPFRPERVTPWPRIQGVIHAHVDSDGSGDYAQIDAQGRYRVHLPFDGSDAAGSSASRWIRLAQPYSGAGYGSHFPLHKGTEVLLAHIDGDPDRPIIVGSVPNPHTLSPSTSQNATQSVIHTASGIRIEMEDLQQ
jgi:type VI secretion system secreted protein VgrG